MEPVQAGKHRGWVRRPATETASDRYAFGDANRAPGLDARGPKERRCCPVGQVGRIPWDSEVAVCGLRSEAGGADNDAAGHGPDADRVMEGDRRDDRDDVVEPVCTFPSDPEAQVDLGMSRQNQ
jgi:hypothetical protein